MQNIALQIKSLCYNSALAGFRCKIIETIRKDIKNDKKLIEVVGKMVTASFGVASLKKEDSSDSLLIRADKAMYQAKKNGKNRVELL